MVYNVCRVISDIRAYCSVMSLALTFAIPNLHRVKDPVQYDKERNEARGFMTPINMILKKIVRDMYCINDNSNLSTFILDF